MTASDQRALGMDKCGAWANGVLVAADLAEQYNGATAHPYRLGDCILLKLNLITKPMVRKNPYAARNRGPDDPR